MPLNIYEMEGSTAGPSTPRDDYRPVSSSYVDDYRPTTTLSDDYRPTSTVTDDYRPTNGPANTSATQDQQSSSKSFKVQLSCGNDIVTFEASMPIAESRNASYSNYDIVHLPTDIWSYKNTTARKFSLSGRIVSRTPDEADLNAMYLDLIRSWTLPDFGSTGATPPILHLSGYRNNNIDDLQVLLVGYSINYSDEVDWIFQGKIPMPVICGVQLELVEVYSPLQITNKAWKIKINEATGNFKYGAAASVVGNDQSINALSIPNIASIAQSFQGLASMPALIKSVGASCLTPTPNNTSSLGISTSSAISQSEKFRQIDQSGLENRAKNVNALSPEERKAYFAYPTDQDTTRNDYGRSNNLSVTSPTVL